MLDSDSIRNWVFNDFSPISSNVESIDFSVV